MAVKILIVGKVHGVFFRVFVEEQAKELGLTGIVRNVPEGVEVIAQGTEPELKKLIEACKHGPESADVEDVKVTRQPDQAFGGFEIVY